MNEYSVSDVIIYENLKKKNSTRTLSKNQALN